MADIIHELSINAPAEDVYLAITTQEGLTRWWTHDTRAEPRVGSVAEFAFNRRAVVFRMRIEQLEPPRRVAWRCLGDNDEWRDTQLSFDLRARDAATIVHFAHRGWRSTDGIFGICNYDWANYLRSLKSYLETGEGMPHAV